jgi:antitoxin component YwqK of YwqJK toxin-antitoxin module
MAETKTEVNRSLHPKTIDKFYVSFFGIPENMSNILGREVQSVSRPNITFNEAEIRHKGVKQVYATTIDYQPIDVIFFDDSGSLVSRSLYEQVRRQTGVEQGEGKFSLVVKIYDANGDVVEEFELKDAHILSINHSEQILTDSTNNIITVSISFNDLDYRYPVLD